MNITHEANTLIVQFPYSPAVVERIKTLPADARRWDGKRKAWTVPVRYFDALRELFPEAAIEKSAEEAQESRTSLSILSSSVDADFDIPGLLGTPMPFQRAGVAFADKSNGRCIIGDEPGLGKTLQALAYLQLHPELRPALIVCPASLKINWQREVDKWMTSGKRTAILSGTKPAELPDADLLIINYDVLHAWVSLLSAAGLKAIICDEAHKLKEPKSRRSKAALALVRRSPHTLLLSGTPILNRPKELWPLLNMIAPNAWPDFFSYAKRYCAAHQETIYQRGGKTKLVWNFNGASHITELHEALRTHMVRRLKSDVLKDLPAKRRAVVTLDIAAGDRRQYKKVLSETQEAIRADESNALAQLEALKQAAVAAKLPAALEWIGDFIESEKLVLFATHISVVAALMDAFPGAVKIDGSMSGPSGQVNRQQSVDTFQNNPDCRLFVGNIQAAGEGITLTAASNVAFLEFPWTPAEMKQGEDRTHRIGQTNSVTSWCLLAEGTVDEDILETLEAKREIVDAVTDGKDGELVFDQSVLQEVTRKTMERIA